MLNSVRSNWAFLSHGVRISTAIGYVLLALCQQGYAQGPEILTEDSDYTLGLEAFSSGEFERAANLWLAEAYNGSVEAQFNVGVLYIQGKGVTRNRVEAAFWFEKAAEQGHPEAQYNLGHLILEDQDDVTLITEGIDWWRRSAGQNFAIAQYNYGRAIFYGIGVEQDRELARNWIEKAATAGIGHAEIFLSEHANEFNNEAASQSAAQSVTSSGRSYSLNNIPLSEELINSSEYLLIGEQSILMYSRFNTFAPVVTRINARVLLRVVERARAWIRVEIPGGVPGWVKLDRLNIEKDYVEIIQDGAIARTDPSESAANNDIGELAIGTRLILLEQQGKWARVLLPENIPGWIDGNGVKKVKADVAEISKVWQAQRIRLKVSALSSREIKIAADSTQSATTSVSSGETRQERDLSNLPSHWASVSDGGSDYSGLSLSGQISQSDGNGFLGPNRSILESGVVGTGRYERSSSANTGKAPDRPTTEPPKAATAKPKNMNTAGNAEIKLAHNTPTTIRLTRQSGVKVRAGASNANATIVPVPANTLVDVIGQKNGFANVIIPGGLPVWMRQSEGQIQREVNVLINGNRVRAFSLSPNDSKAKSLGLLAAGTVVRLIDKSDQGFRVIAPEEIAGWISLTDLKKTDNAININQVWRAQSNSLLASYLDTERPELAVVAASGDIQLSGTGITNDNNWLFEESSKGFTLQLFSIRNQSSALSQFRSLNGRGQLFSTKVKGVDWYFVLFGKFLTRESAKLAAKQLPNWARVGHVRSIKRLQGSRCKKITELDKQEALNLRALCS